MAVEHIKLTTEDGFKLDASYFHGQGFCGVIYTHGATSHREREKFFERVANELSKNGIHCLSYDLRGHGKSEGDSVKDFKISGIIKDLASAVEYLKSKGAKSIGFAGASLGASVSSVYASQHNEIIKALLLINPVLNYHTSFFEPTTADTRMLFKMVHARLETHEYFELPWSGFRLSKVAFDELRLKLPEHDPLLALEKYEGQLLIIHGDKDKTVSYAETLEYFERISNKKKRFITIRGADHCFPDEPGQSEVVTIATKFFLENLRG